MVARELRSRPQLAISLARVVVPQAERLMGTPPFGAGCRVWWTQR